MTKDEFKSAMKTINAQFGAVPSMRSIELAQNALQQMRAAMLPSALIEFYNEFGGGGWCQDSVIFSVDEIDRVGKNYIIPDIVKINRLFADKPGMRGRMIWGRNGLFLFGADAYGTMYMLDQLSLQPLRKYEGAPWRAMNDCLVIGKI